MEARMKMKWTGSDTIVVAVQMILSVVFLYLVKNILPMKYWLIVAALLGVLGFYVFRKQVT